MRKGEVHLVGYKHDKEYRIVVTVVNDEIVVEVDGTINDGQFVWVDCFTFNIYFDEETGIRVYERHHTNIGVSADIYTWIELEDEDDVEELRREFEEAIKDVDAAVDFLYNYDFFMMLGFGILFPEEEE